MRRQARVEEAYHALALGDPTSAIMLALAALNVDLDLWELLQEAVEQAPKGLLPEDTKQRAADALNRALQYHDPQENITAVVLYTWMGGDVPVPGRRV